MLAIEELATLLNALRYYCEHNRPHEQETALIAKLEEIAGSYQDMKKRAAHFLEAVEKIKTLKDWQEGYNPDE